jgi:DNA-binding YbaB/EbfC family protein
MAKGFPGFPGGGMGNMQALMKQAQKMQEQLQKVQSDAEQYTAEGSAGGGVVKITANGQNRLLSVAIDKQCVNPDDVEMLQDLVLVAANDALQKVQENLKSQMSKITGGMNIPGL